MAQVFVVRRQTGKDTPLQRVLLKVGDAIFRLPLVLRDPWPAGNHRKAVVTRESQQFGVQLRIQPVGAQDSRLQVVEVQGPGNAAEGAPGVLEPANEMFGVLAEERLTVRLARIA